MAAIIGLQPIRIEAQPDAAHVVVHLDACIGIDPERFHRLLDIELETLSDQSSEHAASATTTTVWLTCIPSGTRLYLEDGATGRSMVRVVDLQHVVQSARGRLLVLLVTEFVVTSWLESHLLRPRSDVTAEQKAAQFEQQHRLAPADDGAQPRVDTQSDPTRQSEPVATHEPERVEPKKEPVHAPTLPAETTTTDTTSEEDDEPSGGLPEVAVPARDAAADGGGRHRWRLGVGLGVRAISSVDTPMLGVELAAAYRPLPALELCLGAQLSRTSFDARPIADGAPRISLTLLNASAAALFIQRVHDFELSAGLGLQSGIARVELVASGNALRPRSSGVKPWHVPMAVFGASYVALADLRFWMKLELGATLQGVNVAAIENPGTASARQVSLASVHGWLGSAAIGADWSF